jgi:hypothetical protein
MMGLGRPARCSTLAETPTHSGQNFITLRTMAASRPDHICAKASKFDRSTLLERSDSGAACSTQRELHVLGTLLIAWLVLLSQNIMIDMCASIGVLIL